MWQGDTMKMRIPLGISNFREIRSERLTYVDKSLLIRDLIDDAAKVILFPRPRRFGKTLNMSMLRAFFEPSPEDRWPLFQDLAIARAGDAYRAHHQGYPTVYLTFKDIQEDSWSQCEIGMAGILAEACREHRYLLDGLPAEEQKDFLALLSGDLRGAELSTTLRILTRHLSRHHGRRVVLLIDEYDTPLQAAYLQDYYGPAVTFFRSLLSGVLKNNDHLYKGVLTGILRVAKDSIFTGLNNLEVYSLLRPEYAEFFGFTEAEVVVLLDQGGCADNLSEVQRWYNGYLFGGQVIYNPWSVLSYLKSEEPQPRPYWAETSGNDLIRELIMEQGSALRPDFEQLLRGEAIEKPILDSVALRDLEGNPGLLWGFLLFTGYLKALRTRVTEDGTTLAWLALPNLEVRSIYVWRFSGWLTNSLGGDADRQAFLSALLAGDAERVEEYLAEVLMRHASFHDTAAVPHPELFYHGLVLGILVSMGKEYDVRSNPEVGHGRCDLLIAPRQAGRAGVVLEFKVADRRRRETLAGALKAAQRQLVERDYAATLRAGGATPVHELAVAWSQKDVRVAHARSGVKKKALRGKSGKKQ